MKLTRSELYIAVGDEQSALPLGDWNQFLKDVVSLRFPDGITVLDGEGQWFNRHLDKHQNLKLKVIIILHEPSRANRDKIDEIRSIWKERYPCESVLKVEQEVEASF